MTKVANTDRIQQYLLISKNLKAQLQAVQTRAALQGVTDEKAMVVFTPEGMHVTTKAGSNPALGSKMQSRRNSLVNGKDKMAHLLNGYLHRGVTGSTGDSFLDAATAVCQQHLERLMVAKEFDANEALETVNLWRKALKQALRDASTQDQNAPTQPVGQAVPEGTAAVPADANALQAPTDSTVGTEAPVPIPAATDASKQGDAEAPVAPAPEPALGADSKALPEPQKKAPYPQEPALDRQVTDHFLATVGLGREFRKLQLQGVKNARVALAPEGNLTIKASGKRGIGHKIKARLKDVASRRLIETRLTGFFNPLTTAIPGASGFSNLISAHYGQQIKNEMMKDEFDIDKVLDLAQAWHKAQQGAFEQDDAPDLSMPSGVTEESGPRAPAVKIRADVTPEAAKAAFAEAARAAERANYAAPTGKFAETLANEFLEIRQKRINEEQVTEEERLARETQRANEEKFKAAFANPKAYQRVYEPNSDADSDDPLLSMLEAEFRRIAPIADAEWADALTRHPAAYAVSQATNSYA